MVPGSVRSIDSASRKKRLSPSKDRWLFFRTESHFDEFDSSPMMRSSDRCAFAESRTRDAVCSAFRNCRRICLGTERESAHRLSKRRLRFLKRVSIWSREASRRLSVVPGSVRVFSNPGTEPSARVPVPEIGCFGLAEPSESPNTSAAIDTVSARIFVRFPAFDEGDMVISINHMREKVKTVLLWYIG